VGLLGAIYWLFRGDPPPIIVKTGSLIFQSKNPINQTVANGYTYTIKDFGNDIRGIKIKKTDGTSPDIPIEDKDSILKIDITLQKFDGSNWVDYDTLTISGVGTGSQKDLVIKTNVDLGPGGNPPPGYTDRWEHNEDYRFGKIEVLKKNGPQPTPVQINGVHYAICIYNRLPMGECYLN